MTTVITRFLVGAFVPSLVMLAVGAVLLAVALGVKKRWKKTFREPFETGILKPPGWGCLERREDALLNLSMLVMATALLWFWLGYVATQGRYKDVVGIAFVLVPFTVFAAVRIGKDMKRARTERLGFLGECLVAEHLAPLVAEGWKVFHDVAMEVEGRKFNIDHVVVGEGGIFAVETKTRSKAVGTLSRENTVTVDGDVATFPHGTKKNFMRRARGQALALRNFLVGEGVDVRFVEPMVVLPGWMVSWKRGGNRMICDPRNIVGQMRKLEAKIPAGTVAKAEDVLERRCRVLRFDGEEKVESGKETG